MNSVFIAVGGRKLGESNRWIIWRSAVAGTIAAGDHVLVDLLSLRLRVAAIVEPRIVDGEDGTLVLIFEAVESAQLVDVVNREKQISLQVVNDSEIHPVEERPDTSSQYAPSGESYPNK